MATIGMLASDDANPEFSGARNPDSALSARFYTRAVQNNIETSKQGRPIFQDIIYVEIMTPGNTLNIIDTPMREEHKRRFPMQWANFQNAFGGEQAAVGTPITSWPFLTKAQAEELKALKFLTVEMLASSSDGQLQTIGMVGGMNPHILRERAKAYLSAAAHEAPSGHLAAELAEAKKLIQDMQKQMAALTAEKQVVKPKKPRKERAPRDPEIVAQYVAKFGRKPAGFATNESMKLALEKG